MVYVGYSIFILECQVFQELMVLLKQIRGIKMSLYGANEI